jgi:hypothetical protein
VRTLGWPYPFLGSGWTDIESRYEALVVQHPEFEHLLGVVRSIRQSGVEDSLAGMTSMHDLIVAAAPVQSPPIDTIAVRAPGSVHSPSAGCVLIEHLSVTGRNDRVERPTGNAVPLFWRFVTEKFGVRPDSQHS